MGSDLKKKPVFLEFYGLPGCGKSTISHLVAEELRKQGKTVSEPTYDVDHRYSKIIRKILKITNATRYTLLSPKAISKLMTVVKGNGYTGSAALNQFINIAQKLLTYRFPNAEYIIFDEGLIQSAISLTQTKNSKSDSFENVKALYRLCPKRKVRILDICVSLEETQDRMVKRAKHDSRIEKIRDKNKRKKALIDFHKQCIIVGENLRTIDIDAESYSAEEAAALILRAI